MRILVVDDSAIMRKLISRAIAKLDGPKADIIEAGDGVQALSLINSEGVAVDLILCDINMPNTDGVSLLRSVKSMPEYKCVPFVIITADVSDERASQAMREGAERLLGKPFTPQAIAEIVNKARAS